MKKYLTILAGVALLTACEKSETTTVNPPGENKTENNTTIVKESPAPSNNTESSTTTKTKTDGDESSTKTKTTTTSAPTP
jgi:hypothetical protein